MSVDALSVWDYIIGVSSSPFKASFDRAGIMKAAAQAAKEHQRVYGSTWAGAMSVSLKAAWQAANTIRRKVAH